MSEVPPARLASCVSAIRGGVLVWANSRPYTLKSQPSTSEHCIPCASWSFLSSLNLLKQIPSLLEAGVGWTFPVNLSYVDVDTKLKRIYF